MRCKSILAVIVLALFAFQAPAASPYNDANDGPFDANNANTWGQGAGVFPNTAGDVATIDSNRVNWVGVPAGVNITLDGGTIEGYGGYGTINQPITIGNTNPAGSFIENTHLYSRLYVDAAAVLTGSGKLTFVFPVGTTSDADTWVQSSNPGFSGDVVITAGNSVRMAADQALGTGNITVDGAGSGLSVAFSQTVMPASVLVTNGGTLVSNVDGVPDMTLANGTFKQAENRLQNLPTSVALQAGTDNVIYGATYDKFMEFKTGSISGAGNVTFKTDTDHNGIWLYNANTLSGTVAVQGKLGIKNAGGLGTVTAPLNITAGGLITDLAAPASSVLHNIAAVNVSDAALILKSTELSTTKITLNAGGGLRINGGTTPLVYTPGTGNVQVMHGAVLDEAFAVGTYTAPTAAQIQNAPAGVQPQLLMGVYRDPGAGDTFTVGPGDGGGAGEILWSGISSMNRRMNLSSTVQEYTAGQGFTVNAMSLTNLTIMGTAKFLGTGQANLTGGGPIEMRTGALSQVGSVPAVNMNGTNQLYLSGSSVVPAASTLNINDGWVTTSATDSINAAGIANVNDGGILVVRSNIVGQIHLKGGGALYNVSTAALASGSFSWDATANNPGHLLLAGDTASLPTDGNYNFILNKDAQNFTSLVLGPNSRLYGMDHQGQPSKVQTGVISAVGDSARLTARRAGTNGGLWIAGKIDLLGKKLIVGDTQAFHTLNGEYRLPTGVYGWEDAPQAGIVALRNGTANPALMNVIGSVEIQAGTLSLDAGSAAANANNLGNAALVDIWQGATLYENDDNFTVSTVFTGEGTIQITNRLTNHRMYVQPKDLGGSVLAAGFTPGHNGGILTVQGYVNFDSLDVGGTLYYPTVDIKVRTDGGNAAAGDHGRLAVTQDVEDLQADLVVSLPVPSADLRPTTPDWSAPGTPSTFITRDLGDMTILTAGGTLSGTFHSAVVDADPKLAGVQTAGPWKVRAGAALVDYDYTLKRVILNGVDIVWTALPGDANLDRSTDVSDLSLLAGNFRKTTGQTWLQADFNFDGAVDVSDLSLLAGRFRQTNPLAPFEGGAPVPEPMTMVLLGLGGLAVLARRRR